MAASLAGVLEPRPTAPIMKSSHRAMTHNVTRAVAPSTLNRAAQLDAVVVPASRGGVALDAAANLSAQLGVSLVVLCSRNTPWLEAAERLAQVQGCWALVVDVPPGYEHELLPTRTAAMRFRIASAHRESDLSLKRNLGLLMARLNGWHKILFLDDDIGTTVDGSRIAFPPKVAYRLTAELDARQMAGLTCRNYPDNSVLCHARRLAGHLQDTFVSGAALAVNCKDYPAPLFPDQYNEDWFFFSQQVAERNLGLIGEAEQDSYDPFANPDRAREEEFGDLLTEGLYTLFEHQSPETNYLTRLDAANEQHWEQYIEVRQNTLSLTRLSLETAIDIGHNVDRVRKAAALRSLEAAQTQLNHLTASICTDYINAWADDLREWKGSAKQMHTFGTTRAIMNELSLTSWHVVGRRNNLHGRGFIGKAA